MTLEERFWSKVEILPSGCWEWTSRRIPQGYGHFWLLGRNVRAHRLAYELTRGDPGDLCVLHHCDNPPCVNPDHLFLGTLKENSEDCSAKGRWSNRKGVRNTQAKLTPEAVLEIRRRYTAGGVRLRDLAGEFGVSESQVHRIAHGVRWRDVREMN